MIFHTDKIQTPCFRFDLWCLRFKVDAVNYKNIVLQSQNWQENKSHHLNLMQKLPTIHDSRHINEAFRAQTHTQRRGVFMVYWDKQGHRLFCSHLYLSSFSSPSQLSPSLSSFSSFSPSYTSLSVLFNRYLSCSSTRLLLIILFSSYLTSRLLRISLILPSLLLSSAAKTPTTFHIVFMYSFFQIFSCHSLYFLNITLSTF